MANIGIIGWGVVGQATGKGFATNKKNKVIRYDKYRKGGNSLEQVIEKSKFIFVCVPTPMFHDHSGIDLSIVDEVVDIVAPKIKGTEKLLIIKSTVLPGTTARYAEKYSRVHFVMNPEFLTEKRANWDFLHPDRTVIGALDKKDAERLKYLYLTILPRASAFFLTDPTSAELAKYMSNIMLVGKIMLANEFYAMAVALGIDYDSVREMVEADPRIGSHIRVPGHDGDLGFGGKCLPKDMVAFLSLGKKLGVDLSVLETIWKKNLKLRKKHDWNEISGVVSKKSEA